MYSPYHIITIFYMLLANSNGTFITNINDSPGRPSLPKHTANQLRNYCSRGANLISLHARILLKIKRNLLNGYN